MALQKMIMLDSGVELPDAYHKVGEIWHISRADAPPAVRANISIYRDSIARQTGCLPVLSFDGMVTGGDYTTFFSTAVLDQTNVNDMSQTYAWMKTQSNLHGFDYRDATDC